MPTTLQTYNATFWNYYNQKKYSQIINDIPILLAIECGPHDVNMYQKLCVFSIIALHQNKPIARTHVTDVCKKYQSVIANTKDPVKTLQHFIWLEYVCKPGGILKDLVANVAPAVVAIIASCVHQWTDKDRTTLNRFIIVLVELESRLSSSKEWTPTFTSAEEAIKFFSTLTADERKTGYPEYLLGTLKVLLSHRDENTNTVAELTKKIRSLANNKNGKDIAIMMSQIIRAGKLLISKGSTPFQLQIVILLNDLYDIVRNKSLSAYEYVFHKTSDVICCTKGMTHAGLQIMETVRSIFVEALKSNNFDENLVSMVSNFAMVEADILSQFGCNNRDNLKKGLQQTIDFVTNNIEKIKTTCGLDRANRTLQKFEAINSAQAIHHRDREIRIMATKLMNCTDEKRRISCMFEIHQLQKQIEDPKQFQTISSIIKGISKKDNSLDSVQLQLLQITVEIDYPRLPTMCLQKLVDDMREMDFYKNDRSCFANLCKSGVCYLQCVAHTQQYRSNSKSSEPLNEQFMLLKKEIEIVVKLKVALGYLAEFLRDEDAWLGKKDCAGRITLAAKLLQRIGETLINRHYKEMAIGAFHLLYKFAKLIDHPLNQMIAAGYIIENIHLASKISEEEIVKALQSFVMQKLRDVATMSADELGSFLFSFLQLTMYTMRHQRNIDHAKTYMKAINKLLSKYDSEKAKYLAPRLKYAEVMFELIVKDPHTTITPVTFIEDIFHRFKDIRCISHSDFLTVPGIVLDLLITLYDFTQPRYELRYTSSLNRTVNVVSIRNGYLFLYAKTLVLTCSQAILINAKQLGDQMKQLDVVFDCPDPVVPTEGKTITWNKDITPLIHPTNCKCFQCTDKFLNALTMDLATVKASAVYFERDYEKSLESFKRIYNHWLARNTLSYSGMLLHYSNCLISNHRDDKSNVILSEALDVCSDYAQAQDISVRMLFTTKKGELEIDKQVMPYADEVRPKPVQSKKKVTSKSSLPVAIAAKERKVYPKRTNLRN